MTRILKGQELLEEIRGAGLGDWQAIGSRLRARFRTGTFRAGLTLVDAIGAAAEEADHHPDLTLRYPHVDVELLSHDAGGVTRRDLRMAARISEVASELEIPSAPAAPSLVELALDTPDHARIAPFWAALLTGDADRVDGDEVVGTDTARTTLWFQATEAHEAPRQRFHLDVWVGADQAAARIEAAGAAGGEVVDDSGAPSFTVLADPDGNRACVCSVEDRPLREG